MTSYYLSINDAPIVGGVLHFPSTGRWTASVLAETSDKLSGKATILLDGQELTGHIVRSEPFAESTKALVVAGNGGLLKQLTAKYYVNATLKTIITETLNLCGETLSTDSDATILAKKLPKFTRSKTSASKLITELAKVHGFEWNFTDSGELKIFSASYVENDDEFELVAHDPAYGTLIFTGVSLTARPFDTIENKNITEVSIEIRDEDLVVVCQYGSGLNRAFGDAVMRFVPSIEPFALYPARVIRQSADLALVECEPFSNKLPALTKIPLRSSPGCKVKIKTGSIVYVGFEAGSLADPFAIATSQTEIEEMTFSASTKIVFNSPSVDLLNGAGVALARKGSVISGTALVSNIPAPFTAVISTGSDTVRG